MTLEGLPPSSISAGLSGTSGHYLSQFRDSTGRWLVPSLDGGPDLAAAGRAQGLSGRGIRVALVDTGVESEHPLIAGALTEERNLTDEEGGDQSGHGTMMALLLLTSAPDVQLVSIKALRGDGYGVPLDLLLAMQMALELSVDLVSMSAGVYNEKCRADCLLCQAASTLSLAGIELIAAAGNVPGQTDCPAKAGVLGNAAMAIAAWDIDEQRLAAYSGDAPILGPVGHFTMKPVAN